jgi:hypothetical protein
MKSRFAICLFDRRMRQEVRPPVIAKDELRLPGRLESALLMCQFDQPGRRSAGRVFRWTTN